MSTKKTPKISTRLAKASHGDINFIIAAFDSTLPHLASIGSGEQWGTIPFSQREGFIQETADSVEKSEKYGETKEKQEVCVFIAEVECFESVPEGAHVQEDEDGKRMMSVGTATVHGEWFPQYLRSQEHLGIADAKDFLYIEVMVTDHRLGAWSKGAGASLMPGIVEYGRIEGKRTLYVDGWAGNDRKLIHYYERQGFRIVGEFSFPRKNGLIWPGTLLKMDLSSEV
ncbi:hypothetical protein BKA64DRAFT_344725 [Cadophora sp. MPI-SDFR-AT-0126]|nr:hypothetical protein BKA64DRAFT_344725 [Leotiomycetes sp. MPI-SDFR-AT-0126]